MLNLTLGLSKALANSGVTVNAVSPGMIQTPAIDRWLAGVRDSEGWGDDIERGISYALRLFPQTVNRLGQVDDIAFIVANLCSPRADFITGTNLHVDGGGNPSLS